MQGEPFRRHLRAIDQPAHHHPDADHALEHDQEGDHPAAPDQAAGNLLPPQEPDEWEDAGQTRQAAQLPMAPFPPEDRLEAVQGHAGIHQAVLGNLLVVIELRLPLVHVQRRNGSRQQFPLRDRDAGIGQPGRAAEHHHAEHQHGDHEQPDRDGTGAALPEERSHARPETA